MHVCISSATCGPKMTQWLLIKMKAGEAQNSGDLSHLDVHFNNRFPNKRCTKEGPERNQKVTTCYPSQVEEGVRDLEKTIKKHRKRLKDSKHSNTIAFTFKLHI